MENCPFLVASSLKLPRWLTLHEGKKGQPKTQKRKVPPGAPKLQMRVEDLQFTGSTDSQQFVEVFPLEGFALNVYAAITKEEGREGYKYVVIEPTPTETEK